MSLQIASVARTWWTLSLAGCSWDSRWQSKGAPRPPLSGRWASATSRSSPVDVVEKRLCLDCCTKREHRYIHSFFFLNHFLSVQAFGVCFFSKSHNASLNDLNFVIERISFSLNEQLCCLHYTHFSLFFSFSVNLSLTQCCLYCKNTTNP